MACCPCLDAYDLAGPRASGNVRHAEMLCYVIVKPVFVSCASVVAAEVCVMGAPLLAWMLRESENAPYTL